MLLILNILIKNFGGCFVIWDRLFGSFQAEEEECVFGVTEPEYTWNPLVHTFGHFGKILNRWRIFPNESKWNKVRWMLYGPGFSPKNNTYFKVPEVDPKTYIKYDPPLSTNLKFYVGIQFVLIISVSLPFFDVFKQLEMNFNNTLFVFYIVTLSVISVVSISKLMDGGEQNFNLELYRLISLFICMCISYVMSSDQLYQSLSLFLAIVSFFSLIWIWNSKNQVLAVESFGKPWLATSISNKNKAKTT